MTVYLVVMYDDQIEIMSAWKTKKQAKRAIDMILDSIDQPSRWYFERRLRVEPIEVQG